MSISARFTNSILALVSAYLSNYCSPYKPVGVTAVSHRDGYLEIMFESQPCNFARDDIEVTLSELRQVLLWWRQEDAVKFTIFPKEEKYANGTGKITISYGYGHLPDDAHTHLPKVVAKVRQCYIRALEAHLSRTYAELEKLLPSEKLNEFFEQMNEECIYPRVTQKMLSRAGMEPETTPVLTQWCSK